MILIIILKPFENISKNHRNIYLSHLPRNKIFKFSFADRIVTGLAKNIFYKKYPGITEYILKSKKKNLKNPVMLIFNKKLSVSPITTHIPVKKINKMIEKKTVLTILLLYQTLQIKAK